MKNEKIGKTGANSPSSPTMKDVARLAAVSQTTVSFVMSGADMRISEDTRTRVLDAARELGYRSRSAGRPARASRPRVVGLLIDEIATSPFAAISIESLQEQAWRQNVLLQIVMTGADRNYENEILRKWTDEQIDGVIYGSILTRKVDPPDGLIRHRAVLLNCYDADARFASIVPAERRGGEVATQALIDEGHRRIAFISGEPWMEASDQRLEGYERALRANDIPINPSLIVEGNFLPSGGREATLRLMHEKIRPDAIFCANDLMAVGCYEALKEMGESIGTTIAVLGYDDQEIAQHLEPPLSTVLLPHHEMGEWCAKALLSKTVAENAQLRVECPLVLRQSHFHKPI